MPGRPLRAESRHLLAVEGERSDGAELPKTKAKGATDPNGADATEGWQDNPPNLSRDLHKAVIMHTVAIIDRC